MMMTTPSQLAMFSSYLGARASLVDQKVMPFRTDTPSKSSRHNRGLYHGKTHGRRFQRCFSMKKSIVTMKPNIKSRTLHSEVLAQSFKLDISMKARRCIMKAGSLDNYLLNTKPQDIDSKFGLHLRNLIKQKKANPEFAVPYIKGTATLPRSRKTSIWEYKQVPAIYMPAHVKVSEDHSKYFLKTPSEMSRFEIAGLEQMLREIDEPDEFIPDEEMLASEEFQDLRAQMLAIQPIRHGMIKKYFDKFKYQRKKRELLLQLLEESEEQAAEILSPSGEFVPYYEAIPEI
jgi:large subunit ribosomal protein L28